MNCFIKLLTPLMAVFSIISCTEMSPSPIHTNRDNETIGDEPRSDITTPGDEGRPEISGEKSVYVCAVLSKDDESRKLALYKDGAKVFDILCGEETHISEEPDTHFLLEGTLFTTYIDKTATYILRNGEELHKINGKEYFKSLLWNGRDLWSLSLPLESTGFRIRKNGALFFSKEDGTPLSFYLDQGDVYLSYYTLLAGSRLTYLMKNDYSVQVKGPHSMEVENTRIHNGKACYIEINGREVLMSYDDKEFRIPCQAGFELIDTDAIPYGEDDFTLILHMQSNFSPMPADLIHNKDTTILSGAGTACHYYFDALSWWRMCLSKDADKWYIFNASTDNETVFKNGYIPSQRCACIDEGTLYVAISNKDSTIQPFVWANGKTMTYRITGILTGICVSPPK